MYTSYFENNFYALETKGKKEYIKELYKSIY